MSQADDNEEEMFLMINPIIALENEMEIAFQEFGTYPDKQDCYYGIDLIHQQLIDDQWDESINEEFSDVGW
jgi:hypothetical protein